MARLTAKERADKERKNPAEEDPEFQIAPMIDILLVLMVFFMTISSTEVLQANRDIILPTAKDAKQKSSDNPSQIIVNLTWSDMTNAGGIEIDSKVYQVASQIVPRLRDASTANPMIRVLVRADRSVRYEFLKGVLRSVGEAGIQNVTFSVVDKEKPPTGAAPKPSA